MKSWIIDVQKDPVTGECFIQLTDEIIKESGLKIGDCLYWIDNHDGSYTLTKEDLTTFINKAYNNNYGKNKNL